MSATGPASLGRAAVAVAIAAALCGDATATAADAPSTMAFGQARLGMSLMDWRALPAPAGAGSDAVAACSNDAAVERIQGNYLLEAAHDSGMVACGYASVLGDTLLPDAFKLDARYRVTDARYLFDHGRLRKISFEVSVDGFDDVMALLRDKFGGAPTTVRDHIRTPLGSVDRVRDIWRTSDGAQIELIDPVRPYTELQVTMAAPSA